MSRRIRFASASQTGTDQIKIRGELRRATADQRAQFQSGQSLKSLSRLRRQDLFSRSQGFLNGEVLSDRLDL